MILYRYENTHQIKEGYSEELDDDGDEVEASVHLLEYNVIRETPHKYVIPWKYKKDRYVSKGTRIAYAYPTKELAIKSFIRRKECQIYHLSIQMQVAKQSQKIAEDMRKESRNDDQGNSRREARHS